MCAGNVEQFWMSTEHAHLSVMQMTVALVLHGARPDTYLRHFLLQQCLLEHDIHFLYVQKT